MPYVGCVVVGAWMMCEIAQLLSFSSDFWGTGSRACDRTWFLCQHLAVDILRYFGKLRILTCKSELFLDFVNVLYYLKNENVCKPL